MKDRSAKTAGKARDGLLALLAEELRQSEARTVERILVAFGSILDGELAEMRAEIITEIRSSPERSPSKASTKPSTPTATIGADQGTYPEMYRMALALIDRQADEIRVLKARLVQTGSPAEPSILATYQGRLDQGRYERGGS